MAQPFLSEIRAFGFRNVPKNWAPCNGQLMDIATNQALFTLLGTAFGGDGVKNFALPNLQGRTIVGSGKSPRGAAGGEAQHTLTVGEIPSHSHMARASEATGQTTVIAGGTLAAPVAGGYAANAGNTLTMSPDSIGQTGASEGHDNMMPSLGLNYCIALSGIYPSRN